MRGNLGIEREKVKVEIFATGKYYGVRKNVIRIEEKSDERRQEL